MCTDFLTNAQVSTVGIPSQIFRPGVLVPEVLHRGVAERSGLRSGDLVTAVAGRRLQASPNSVNELVNVIKCGICLLFEMLCVLNLRSLRIEVESGTMTAGHVDA